MTDLTEAFVLAAKQTAVELELDGTNVLLRGTAQTGESFSEPVQQLDVVVGGEVVGHVVRAGAGYAVVGSGGTASEASTDSLEDGIAALDL